MANSQSLIANIQLKYWNLRTPFGTLNLKSWSPRAPFRNLNLGSWSPQRHWEATMPSEATMPWREPILDYTSKPLPKRFDKIRKKRNFKKSECKLRTWNANLEYGMWTPHRGVAAMAENKTGAKRSQEEVGECEIPLPLLRRLSSFGGFFRSWSVLVGLVVLDGAARSLCVLHCNKAQ